ncbi:tyrosine--tRNA ligase [Methylobacterium terricola]|uniref:Tyrosine--tRNA ligase n=1 Tax=Methylobacterium terricola TaxID=2583531 RepID=A0A5C4LK74_9HYPH|nr:tyrosine--tRNA ligase [Methylobacterium terricola]TNC14162.1 tyrosine--tRNA ligase [Methylobacterium terricola]
MPAHRSDFVRALAERGFIHQCTDLDGLDVALSGPPRAAYIGFDATADSLHTGHLMQVMPLRWLQRCGHKPIVVIGGGTTRIGDPSFRDSSRPLLDEAQIAANVMGLRQVFGRYLTFGDGATDAVLVNNADWLDALHLIPFLRDVGRHFTVNRMLSFDSVRTRLDREEPLTLLEFNYMILQAFDFLELSRRHGCILQMGGSDQWGNIVNGLELGRRVDQRQLFGLTTPLLTTASGTKMGKTAGGAVWLNADRLAPYGFWQFWRNTEDADVGRFLRLFTDLPLDEIARLEALEGTEINAAKAVLAHEATKLAHGEAAALAAAGAAREAFSGGAALDGLPTIVVERDAITRGISVVDLLVAAGLVGSKSEARRLIAGRGARLNDAMVSNGDAVVTIADVGAAGMKVSYGRKRHVVVRIDG